MRLSELISAIRHRVNDSAAKYHTDADITAWVNLHARSLFRRRVEADTSYGNQRLVMLASDVSRIEQIYSDTWRYYTPGWCYKVRRVAFLEGDTIGRDLRREEWSFSGNRSFDVRMSTGPKDLVLMIAKVPALIRPISVSIPSSTYDELYVPVEAGAGYKFETEIGCMLGAQFEITTVDGDRDPRGGVSVVTEQSSDKIDGVSVWKLTMRPPFVDLPMEGDSLEMHVEIEDVHITYLIDLVAHDLFQRTQNVTAMQMIRPVLEKCERDFILGLQPRTDGMLTTISQGEEMSGYSEDVDPFWEYP